MKLEANRHLSWLGLGAMHGISVGEPQLDWTALIDREKRLISRR